MKANIKFDSEYKPCRFTIQKEVFFKKVYGYVPVVFVYAETKEVNKRPPRFTIQQGELDRFRQWHNFLYKFILLLEDYNESEVNFYYQVADYRGEIIEKGKIK